MRHAQRALSQPLLNQSHTLGSVPREWPFAGWFQPTDLTLNSFPLASRQLSWRKTMKRHRYQYGSLTKTNNRLSEDVWQFRFYETTPEGHRYRRSTTLGTVAQYPTKTDALRVVEPLRLRLNLHHRFGRPVSIGALIDHYIERELPGRRYSTQQSHSSTLKRWILPRWGERLLEEIRPVAVEEWLRSLTLAPKTKVNLRSLFHLIYEHARRWELTDRNPIDLVRQHGGRRCIPRVLSPSEIRPAPRPSRLGLRE